MRKFKHNIFLFNKKGLIVTAVLLTQTLVGVGVITDNSNKKSILNISNGEIRAKAIPQSRARMGDMDVYTGNEDPNSYLYEANRTFPTVAYGVDYSALSNVNTRGVFFPNRGPSNNSLKIYPAGEDKKAQSPVYYRDMFKKSVTDKNADMTKVLNLGTTRVRFNNQNTYGESVFVRDGRAQFEEENVRKVQILQGTKVDQVVNIGGRLFGIVKSSNNKDEVIRLETVQHHYNSRGFKFGVSRNAEEMDVPRNRFQKRFVKTGMTNLEGYKIMIERLTDCLGNLPSSKEYFKNTAEMEKFKVFTLYSLADTLVRSTPAELTEFNVLPKLFNYQRYGFDTQGGNNNSMSFQDSIRDKEQKEAGLILEFILEEITRIICDSNYLKNYLNLKDSNEDQVALHVASVFYQLNTPENEVDWKTDFNLMMNTCCYFTLDKEELTFLLTGGKDGYSGEDVNKKYKTTMYRFMQKNEELRNKIWKEIFKYFENLNIPSIDQQTHGSYPLETMMFYTYDTRARHAIPDQTSQNAVMGYTFYKLPLKSYFKNWYVYGYPVFITYDQGAPDRVYIDTRYNSIADADAFKYMRQGINNSVFDVNSVNGPMFENLISESAGLFLREVKAILKAVQKTQDKYINKFRTVWEKAISEDKDLKKKLGKLLSGVYDYDEKAGLQEFADKESFLAYVKSVAGRYKTLTQNLSKKLKKYYGYRFNSYVTNSSNANFMKMLYNMFAQGYTALDKLFKEIKSAEDKGTSNYLTTGELLKTLKGINQLFGNRIMSFNTQLMARDYKAYTLYINKLKTIKNNDLIKQLNENFREFLKEISKMTDFSDIKQVDLVANLIGNPGYGGMYAYNMYGKGYTTRMQNAARNINKILVTLKTNGLVENIKPFTMLIKQIVQNETLEIFLSRNLFREMYNIMNFNFERGKTDKNIKVEDFKLDIDTSLTPGENYKNLMEAFLEFAQKDRSNGLSKYITFSSKDLLFKIARVKEGFEKVAKLKEEVFDVDKLTVEEEEKEKEEPTKTKTKTKKEVKEVVKLTAQQFADLVRGKPITMPIFINKENSVLAQGEVTYRLNGNNIEVELKGIAIPQGLNEVYVVPILEDQVQQRVILQKVGDSYKGTVSMPSVKGRLSLHFYFINPAARENGPDPQFRIGAADICNIENVESQLLSEKGTLLKDVYFYNKAKEKLTDRPTPYVFDLKDYVFVLLESDKPTQFNNNMMASVMWDSKIPDGGANHSTVSTFPVMDKGKYYCGILIYKNIKSQLTPKVTVHFYKNALLDPNFDSYLEFYFDKREVPDVEEGKKKKTDEKDEDRKLAEAETEAETEAEDDEIEDEDEDEDEDEGKKGKDGKGKVKNNTDKNNKTKDKGLKLIDLDGPKMKTKLFDEDGDYNDFGIDDDYFGY